MIITTSDIVDKKYEIIDVVFAFGSAKNGIFKTENPSEGYPKVKELLKEKAKELGADAIIGVRFNYRDIVNQGCGTTTRSFEVHGYGTAIKFK
ncbi:YbjQ family protein [Patescibacteria group bacterium]|nr:YbjQ family protein [Patescibacteria group bacterium]MBU4016209.1 YbjQ family protein [Patescibacteria group bacterium]MBU4098667.1 YbjQ family protein [Patescibacteria group bacterium]